MTVLSSGHVNVDGLQFWNAWFQSLHLIGLVWVSTYHNALWLGVINTQWQTENHLNGGNFNLSTSANVLCLERKVSLNLWCSAIIFCIFMLVLLVVCIYIWFALQTTKFLGKLNKVMLKIQALNSQYKSSTPENFVI